MRSEARHRYELHNRHNGQQHPMLRRGHFPTGKSLCDPLNLPRRLRRAVKAPQDCRKLSSREVAFHQP